METLHALLVSFVFSFLVGMERQLAKKPVGFAPYVFVTVLSTALAILAKSIFSANLGIILSGIITGIGFLGAGALIRHHEKVSGFTTASSIWAMAALGIIVALADLSVVLFCYAAIWIVFLFDRLIEHKGLGRHYRTVSIEVRGMGSHSDIKAIISRYRDSKEEAIEMNFDRGIVEYKFLVPALADIDGMVKNLSKLGEIRKIQVD